MITQDITVRVDNLSRLSRARTQLFNHACVVTIRDKAYVLTVRFVRNRQPVFRGQGARRVFGRQMAEWETQIIQLLWSGREQEIRLVAVRIGGAMQFGTIRAHHALYIVTRRHAVGIQILCRLQEVFELHALIATDARHRGRACEVAVGEFIDHGFLEDVFVVEHVVREAHFLGHAAGVMNVTTRTARAFFRQRRPVIIKLEGHADHVIAFFGELRGDYG